MKVIVLDAVAKEMKRESDELKQSVYGVLQRLEMGELIPMPLCRPLYAIAKGLHEIRLSDKVGEFRVFYYMKIGDAIYVIHATRKKTQKMEQRVIDLLKQRIRNLP